MTKNPLIRVLVLFLACLTGCLQPPQEFDDMNHPDDDFKPKGRAVPVLEPTTGQWVNDNTWGDQFAGPLPQSEGREIQIVKNQRFYGPPAVHSVILTRSDAILAQNADVRAHITFGTGGVQNEFFCDWYHGVQFSLPANTITVAAKTFNPVAALPYVANDASIFLGAMLAKGDVAPARPLTLTEPFVTLGAFGGPDPTDVTYTVPDYAVGFRLYAYAPEFSTDPTVLSQLDVRIFANLLFAKFDGNAAALGREMTLPGGATEVAIQNQNPLSVANLALQWVLQL